MIFLLRTGKLTGIQLFIIINLRQKKAMNCFTLISLILVLKQRKILITKAWQKKYTTHAIFEEYAEDVNQYLSYMQETGYVCEEKW